jgi:hypothetical protein
MTIYVVLCLQFQTFFAMESYGQHLLQEVALLVLGIYHQMLPGAQIIQVLGHVVLPFVMFHLEKNFFLYFSIVNSMVFRFMPTGQWSYIQSHPKIMS